MKKLSALQQQMLALAGTFQAATLVRQVATTGKIDQAAFNCSIQSLFVFDPKDVLHVYGNLAGLSLGLQSLRHFLLKVNPRDKLVIRYVMGLMHLQKLLMHDHDMVQTIYKRLDRTALHLENLSIDHSTIITSIANIYSDNLSNFRYRIPIYGHSTYLQQQECINQVRASLFAGLRSVTLWRQVGGRYWQFLFLRKKMLQVVEDFLARLPTE
jgi:high frequency lysogenization protein